MAIIRDATGAPSSIVLQQVEAFLDSKFGRAISDANNEREELLSNQSDLKEEVEGLEKDLQTISEYSAQKTFSMPPSTLARVMFWIFAILGVGFLAVDAGSLAGYLLPTVQKIWVAIFFSALVMAVPLAEAGLLAQKWVSERMRHVVMCLDGVVAIVFFGLYLRFSLDYGDYSLEKAFSENPVAQTGLSTAELRMLFQVVASMATGALFLAVALETLVRSSEKTPEHEAKKAIIKFKLNEAASKGKQAKGCEAVVRATEKEREQHFLFAKAKLDALDSERHGANEKLLKILGQAAACLLLGLPTGLVGCSPGAAALTKPHDSNEIVVAVSPFLKDRSQVVKELTRWLVAQSNSVVRLYDGWEGTKITEFSVPHLVYFNVDAAASRIGSPIRKLAAWSRMPGDAKYAGTGALRLPLLMNRISQGLAPHSRLIIIGSPVGRGPEPKLNFVAPELRVPAIEAFKSKQSPFFVRDWKESLARHDIAVDFVFPREDTSKWPTSFEDDLKQVWGTFFATHGADLVSFTPDLSSALQSKSLKPLEDFASLLSEPEPIPPPPPPEPVNHTPAPVPNPELVLTNSPKDQLVSATGTNVPAPSIEKAKPRELTNSPPAQMVVKATTKPLERARRVVQLPATGVALGIRYQSDTAQADLFVKPNRDSDEISFRTPKTSLGSYSAHYDFTGKEQVKWVYFPNGLDLQKATVWLNYPAGGVGRLTGRLFWLSADSEVELPFSFICLNGGDGRKRPAFRRGSIHWQQVNLLDLVSRKNSLPPALSSFPGDAPLSGAAVARELVNTKP